MFLCSMNKPFFPFLSFFNSLFASQEGEKKGETADQMAEVWLKKNKQQRLGSYNNKR